MSILTTAKRHVKNTGELFRDKHQVKKLGNDTASFFIGLLRFLILIGVAYVILEPVIGLIVNSFSSSKDVYNPMVFILPQYPTLERYKLAAERMEYLKVMPKNLLLVITLTVVQVFICAMVGYGFARFQFPFKKLLFGCVVMMIVIPTHTVMLPWYVSFRNFDPAGLISAVKGSSVSLMATPWPIYIMSALGCGLKSGLYIYIFNQFFRGLPKEIEEAALVDGAGMWRTFWSIMLVNASPAVITVTVFSIVWQFNDTFLSNLFLLSKDLVISNRISTLQNVISNLDKIMDTKILELYLDAGIILILLPVVIIYLVLQRYFIEGVERSGIVG